MATRLPTRWHQPRADERWVPRADRPARAVWLPAVVTAAGSPATVGAVYVGMSAALDVIPVRALRAPTRADGQVSAGGNN